MAQKTRSTQRTVKVGDEVLITEYNGEHVSTVARVTEYLSKELGEFYAEYISGDELETYSEGRIVVVEDDSYVILADKPEKSVGNLSVNITMDDEVVRLISNLAKTVAKQERKIEALRHKTDYSDNLLLERIEALEERQGELEDSSNKIDEELEDAARVIVDTAKRTHPQSPKSFSDHIQRARR